LNSEAAPRQPERRQLGQESTHPFFAGARSLFAITSKKRHAMSKLIAAKAKETQASRSKSKDKKKKPRGTMPVTSPNLFAAGIDIGSTEIYVCALENGEQVVKSFGVFTCDLKRMVEWMKGLKVKTVAMESTGYW
jgi:activator of 2-hydroxyglutaryl-CoA dehydratase